MTDASGYERIAEAFMTSRDPRIGAGTVRAWASRLPPFSDVLDLGCGNGIPISEVLLAEGHRVHGIDASPTMVAAFRARFPASPVACEPVERSAFFGGSFDAAVAWGLIFLLEPDVQREVLRRAAAAIRPGGGLLFTSPGRECRWVDVLTGRTSVSLGAAAYRAELGAAGLVVVAEHDDDGDNHYYEAVRE